MTRLRADKLIGLLCGFLLAGLGGGCISASLASTTGSRPAGLRWSTAGRQMVHVGEEVRFDVVLVDWLHRFVSPTGFVDYCVVRIGPLRMEAEPDPTGHFGFVHRFQDVSKNKPVQVAVTAYRQRGPRDFVRVRSEWIAVETASRQPDEAVAFASLALTPYQAAVDLRLVRPPDDLDPDTGVLRLSRIDGRTTSVYVDRPNRRGFRLEGPSADGYYRARYEPTGDEVNPTGTTPVEFSIFDVVGQRHTASVELSTP